MSKEFDHSIADSQATAVVSVAPDAFDFQAYEEYEAELLAKCQMFQDSSSGVMVYRRMRAAEVFSYGCRDMEASLALQLGALTKSMEYAADIPNFLEPWYGIGTVASAFGIDYTWHPGQAPAFAPKFKTVREALDSPVIPVKDTPIGQFTLTTLEYFLEKTQGRLPISLCDVQSPLNIACQIVDMTSLFMDLFDSPDRFSELLDRLAELLAEFTEEQITRLDTAAVRPGHGFASTRVFKGFGMSDDNALMLSPEQYRQYAVPAMVKAAAKFGGPVFHSCGNWSHLAPVVIQIPGLQMADGAFSAETDPTPNDAEAFPNVFADSGVILNARIVGDCSEIETQVKKVWKPPMKLIVVTYCQRPDEQQRAYEMIHEICQ